MWNVIASKFPSYLEVRFEIERYSVKKKNKEKTKKKQRKNNEKTTNKNREQTKLVRKYIL